jgi:hypothetical protein
MNRTIEAKTDRALTEQELIAVTGGTIMPPTNSTIPINKPTFPLLGLGPKI